MSQTEKLPALSQYERFVLESLYRQAAEEAGHPPNAQARQRILRPWGKISRRHVLTGGIKKPGIRRRHFTGNRAVP
ncbi:hypothetical protein ACFA8O_004031 [Salmonella enterica]